MKKAAISKLTRTYEAGAFTKRIGPTIYRVNVHFSGSSNETAKDKITRLVRMEAHTGTITEQRRQVDDK